jgi:hypothetical protein
MLERRMAGSKPGTSNVAAESGAPSAENGADENADAFGTTEPSRAS